MNYNKEEALNYYKEITETQKDLLQKVSDALVLQEQKDSVQNKKLAESISSFEQKMEDAFLNLQDNSGYITHIATVNVPCADYLEHTLMKSFLESKGFISNNYLVNGNKVFSTVVGSDSAEGVEKIIQDINDYAAKYYMTVKSDPIESKKIAFNTMMKVVNPILLGSKVDEVLSFPLKESISVTHSFTSLSKKMVNALSIYNVKEFEFNAMTPDPSKSKLSLIEAVKKLPKAWEDTDRINYQEEKLNKLKSELQEKTGINEKIDYKQYNVDGKTATKARAIQMEFDRFQNLIDTTPHVEVIQKPSEPSAIKSFLLGIKNRVDNAIDNTKDALQKGGEIFELKSKIESEQEMIFKLTGLNIEIDIKQHFIGELSVDNALRGSKLELERFEKISKDLLKVPNIVEEVSERGLSQDPERVEEKAKILRKNGVKI
jgi:hypothetical protein